ncbi:potassium voltage-gated channel protein Shab [Eurytemora carolleeae]|uniref:potassium voltage-gated channel protein Shab n=1 Tax=Eurytemora carolleeae TaxID=1294199 RepID=UPI000C7683A3|nr:potassium voltage-gated channel protein Shab [Eurytemora carolleeae]|eukprot:XP_023326887.1 potassium voltage-gated channel protein Shab-like [Eurytemora affinis]
MENGTMKLDTMNNVADESLPDKVEDMYKILVEISRELERIKFMLNKRQCETDDHLNLSFENIIQNELQNNRSINLIDNNRSLDKSSEKNCRQKNEMNSSSSHQSLNKLNFTSNHTSSPPNHTSSPPNHASSPPNHASSPLNHTSSPLNNLTLPKEFMTSNMFGGAKVFQEETNFQLNSIGPIRPPSPFLIVANKILKGPVILNVGGKKHEVRWNTLDKYPTSRLGRLRHCVTHRGLQQICDSYSLEHREYYFDRSPRNFDAILCLYRTGKLHLSQGVCVQDFCEELEYWGLDDLHMEPCCQHTYYRARWLLPETDEKEEKEEDFGSGFCAPTQKHLWNLFENPHHSFAAKCVAVVSCLFVVVSTLCLIISTLPSFQQKDLSGIAQEEYFFEVAEAVFVGWFTFEYVIRFIAAPHKIKFLKAVMNIIDLLGILPYFMSLSISLITTSGGLNTDQAKYQDEMRRIAQIFRIMRILRIFKLARHITGLQTLGMTLRNSYKELGLLMLVVIMGMLIFSGLAYVAEKDEVDTNFISMPQALYWAIITMTSVGYGDISPTTWFGKLVGSACAICGVLCISLPIPIIVNNFNKFYEKAKIEEEILLKKKKASWEDAKRGVFQNIHDSFEELSSAHCNDKNAQFSPENNFEDLIHSRKLSLIQCTSPSSKVSMISGGQVLGFHESSHTINSSGGHMETPLVNNFTNSTNSQDPNGVKLSRHETQFFSEKAQNPHRSISLQNTF